MWPYFITGLVCFALGCGVGGLVVFLWIVGGVEYSIGKAFGWR